MSQERRVKLFRSGRNQAVRIPREFELPGDEAVMHKEGDRLIIEPGQSAAQKRLSNAHGRRLGPLDDVRPREAHDAVARGRGG